MAHPRGDPLPNSPLIRQHIDRWAAVGVDARSLGWPRNPALDNPQKRAPEARDGIRPAPFPVDK
jgi:hypothetical protein